MSDDYEESLTEEEYENDALFYQEFYKISSDVNVVLQFFTVFINIVHLIVLSRPDLRSGAIYQLMIGICIADILYFFVNFYDVGFERGWFKTIPFYFNSGCLKIDYVSINLAGELIHVIVNMMRPLAIWLAILMALIRALSVMFPMNTRIQRITTTRVVIPCIIALFLFWCFYYSWGFVYIELIWYPDNLYPGCLFYEEHLNQTSNIFVMTQENFSRSTSYSSFEYLVRIVPAFIYPILTVALLIELKAIKNKTKNSRKNSLDDRSSSTTKLIIFMTVCFMIGEGLEGFVKLIQSSLDVTDHSNIYLISNIGLFQYVCYILRMLNAATHAFVCFAMSSQYRDTVKGMLYFSKKSSETIINVKSGFIQSQSFKETGFSNK